jgi:hypothetical protein
VDGSPAFSWSKHATHMGHLARGDVRWEVFLEILTDADKSLRRGRVHFVAGERHRESAWIFVEVAERDVLERFNEFSAVELWSLLESLGP